MKAEWHIVEAWANERLLSARQRLEGDLDAIKTAELRGRIAMLKELIALPRLTADKAAQSSIGAPEQSDD